MLIKYQGQFVGKNGMAASYPTNIAMVRFEGDSTLPMTYSINGNSFVVNDGYTIKNLKIGDVVTIEASSVANKTFSLRGLDNFTLNGCTWNHKSSGSIVSANATLNSLVDTTIGYDDYRDKRFSAYCSFDMCTSSQIADDYQPGLYVVEISSNCLKDNYYNGVDFATDVSCISNANKSTGYRTGWSQENGWAQYGPENQTPQYMVNNVLGYSKVGLWEEQMTVTLTELKSTQSKIGFYMYDNFSAGGTKRRWKSGYASLNQTSSWHNSKNGYNGYGPTYCSEMGRGAGDYNPVNQSGFMTCSGILR